MDWTRRAVAVQRRKKKNKKAPTPLAVLLYLHLQTCQLRTSGSRQFPLAIWPLVRNFPVVPIRPP